MPAPSHEDDPAWTCIKRGKSGKPGRGDTYVAAQNGPDKDLTFNDLKTSFDKKMKLWRQSSARANLVLMLERNEPEEGWKIRKAVCLAVGSFSTLNLEKNNRSLLQLAAFVNLARELGKRADVEVELFAQDPIFQPIDKVFLASLDVTVLPSECSLEGGLENANEHLGPETLLCEFFMDMSKSGLEDLVRAGNKLYIGSSFLRHNNGRSFLENHEVETKVLVERFQKEHAQRWFPNFEENENVFRGLMVYWKEDQDSDLEGDGR